MIKNITKHILEVDADDIKNNIINDFMSILHDYTHEHIDDLKIQIDCFHKVVGYLKNYDWNCIFSEGYTMMALSADDFKFVDDFFQCKKNGGAYKNDELEIHIMKTGQFICRIDENSIDF